MRGANAAPLITHGLTYTGWLLAPIVIQNGIFAAYPLLPAGSYRAPRATGKLPENMHHPSCYAPHSI